MRGHCLLVFSVVRREPGWKAIKCKHLDTSFFHQLTVSRGSAHDSHRWRNVNLMKIYKTKTRVSSSLNYLVNLVSWSNLLPFVFICREQEIEHCCAERGVHGLILVLNRSVFVPVLRKLIDNIGVGSLKSPSSSGNAVHCNIHGLENSPTATLASASSVFCTM